MAQVRSKLRKWVATAQHDESDTPDVWVVWFQGNNPQDRRDWVVMAQTGGFRNIKLERVIKSNRDKVEKVAQT